MTIQDFNSTISRKYSEKLAALGRGDVSFVMDFYSEDAISVSHGQPPAIGRKAILAAYSALVTGPVPAAYRSFRAAQTSPTTGYDFADFRLKPVGNKEWVELRFLFLWKVVNNDWRCNGYLAVRNESFFPLQA